MGTVLAASLHPAAAATYSYTGGTGNFSTGFNPTISTGGTTSPTSTTTTADTLSFGGATGIASYTATDDLTTTININALSFSNGAGVMATLMRGGSGSANSITLGGTATAPNVTTGAGAVVNGLDLILAANTKFNIGGGSLTASGIISDGGNGFGLTKSGNGNGTLTLTGNNTYSGATSVTIGGLAAGVASVANVSGAFGNNSAITLANTSGVGIFLVSTVGTTQASYDTQVGSLSGGGTAGGNIILGTATLTIGGDNTSTAYAGTISSTGRLTKIGTGTQTLSGTNTYTGGTNFNGGILNVGSKDALGNTGALSFGGGTLQYGTGITTDYSNRFSNKASQAYSIDTNGQSVTFASALTSSGGTLTKSGTGTLILLGTNTYTGGTTVSGGTLSGNAGSYGSGAITVASSATVDYTQSGTGTATNNISGAGSATFGNYVTSANGTKGTITYTGQDSAAHTTVQSGTLVLNNSGGSALQGPVAVAVGGVVQLATSNQIAATAPGSTNTAAVTLNGGILNATGHSDGSIKPNATSGSTDPTQAAVATSMGTLTLGNTSTLNFGSPLAGTSGPIVLAFADSHTIAWSGTLNIINYTGGTDALYIGNSSGGLTPTQLGQISFNGVLGATQLGNGEVLAAAPEPSELVSILVGVSALGGLIGSRRKSAGRASRAKH